MVISIKYHKQIRFIQKAFLKNQNRNRYKVKRF